MRVELVGFHDNSPVESYVDWPSDAPFAVGIGVRFKSADVTFVGTIDGIIVDAIAPSEGGVSVTIAKLKNLHTV
jgi:hypothetical protein